MVKKRGRPKKTAAQRKSVDLRIPVTAEQKRAVVAAAELEGRDMATWAREILLKAAEATAVAVK